eukprot:1668083-Amphidinium_carterae.1
MSCLYAKRATMTVERVCQTELRSKVQAWSGRRNRTSSTWIKTMVCDRTLAQGPTVVKNVVREIRIWARHLPMLVGMRCAHCQRRVAGEHGNLQPGIISNARKPKVKQGRRLDEEERPCFSGAHGPMDGRSNFRDVKI